MIKTIPNSGWRIFLQNQGNSLLFLEKGTSIVNKPGAFTIGINADKQNCTIDKADEAFNIMLKEIQKADIKENSKITIVVEGNIVNPADYTNYQKGKTKIYQEENKESQDEDFFIDSRDNQKYPIVKINNQVWMAKNLNYASDSSVCYDNKKSNCITYGRLYNWETAKNVCPAGWKLPKKEDFIDLVNYMDTVYVINNKDNFLNGSGDQRVANTLWDKKPYLFKNPPEMITNLSGFSAIPAGATFWLQCAYMGEGAYFWSSTVHPDDEFLKGFVYSLNIFIEAVSVDAVYEKKEYLTVRCIKK